MDLSPVTSAVSLVAKSIWHNVGGLEELDGPAVSALRRAIAEVKQRCSFIRWVTKILLSRAPPCCRRHAKPLVSAAFAVVSTHQPALGPHYNPSSLCLIYKEGTCAPAVGAGDDNDISEEYMRLLCYPFGDQAWVVCVHIGQALSPKG
jgi:hypothetical protein